MRILWICDQEGWAYDSIVDHVGALLPEYEHRRFYFCSTADTENHDLLRMFAESADVIVSMYLRYQEVLGLRHKHKVVTMLTGFRPFEV